MPMIALSPVRWFWQKTTCSWSARPADGVPGTAPFSSWGIANTLVTVATLLIPSRLLVEPGSEPGYCVRGLASRMPGCPEKRGKGWGVPYWPVTHSRDDVVILTAILAVFWYVTIRQS